MNTNNYPNISQPTAYLGIDFGPMFSGKTTRIVQQYKRFSYIGKKVVVINYVDDTRYHDSLLSTHDKIMIPCIFARTLREVKETTDAADVILINEGQFFEDIYESVLEMVETHRKVVYICGLDGDFKRNKFGRLLDLVPYCDEIVKHSSLCAYCKNGTPGIFSHRISNETSQVVIGVDNYVPLCRNCYNTANMNCGNNDI